MKEIKTLKQDETNELLKKKESRSRRRKLEALIFVWIILVIMYLPIMYLIIFSFTDGPVIGQWTGLSFSSYSKLFNFDNPDTQILWQATWNTIWIAVVSSTLSTILGTSGAIGMHFLGKKLKTTLNIATQIPIVNAEIVMATSLCILFVALQLPLTAFTLIIGHIVLTLPFVVINVQPKLEQMDPSLYEAAMDLGATRTGALFKVMIPDLIPGIISGFMISMTLSLDDFVITYFTKPKAYYFQTISTYVQGLLSRSQLPLQLRSFTSFTFLLIVGVMVAYTIISNKKSSKA